MISLDKQYWVDIKSLLVWPVMTKNAQQDWDIWKSHCEKPINYVKLTTHGRVGSYDQRTSLTVPYVCYTGKVEYAKFFVNTSDQSFIFCKKDKHKLDVVPVAKGELTLSGEEIIMDVLCISLQIGFSTHFVCSEPEGTYSHIEKAVIMYGTDPLQLTHSSNELTMFGIKLITENESSLEKVRSFELKKIQQEKQAKMADAKKAVAKKIDELGFDSQLISNQELTIHVMKPDAHFNKLMVRYDNSSQNGYNSLAIICSGVNTSGCANADIVQWFNEYIEKGASFKISFKSKNDTRQLDCDKDTALALLDTIKELTQYHLCSNKGPMHYIENAMYHKENKDLKACQSTACWPELTSLDEVTYDSLVEHIQPLMKRFRYLIGQLDVFVY